MKKLLLMGVLLGTTVATFAQPSTVAGSLQPLDIGRERSRIQAERAREETHSAKEEAACYARFAVTDCLREVRLHRRDVLDKLRHEELALNDAERQQKALEQMDRIREKSSPRRIEEEAARRLQAQADRQEREERATQKVAASMTATSAQVADGKSVQKPVKRGRTADDVAKAQRQYKNKLRQAQEHRASREKINLEKAGTASKPLPKLP